MKESHDLCVQWRNSAALYPAKLKGWYEVAGAMEATLLTRMGADFGVGDPCKITSPRNKTFNLFQVAGTSYGPLTQELKHAAQTQA